MAEFLIFNGEVHHNSDRFQPRVNSAMELLMAANFLDLPDLVSCCVDVISENIDALPSFGDIPSQFISMVCTSVDCPPPVFSYAID